MDGSIKLRKAPPMFPFIKKKTPGQMALLSLGALGAVFVITIVVSLATRLVSPTSHRVTNAIVTNKGESFNVSGEASVEAEPDEARISLGVQAQSNTVKAAQDQVNTVINNLTTQLKTLGLDGNDIKTTDYSIYPNYDWSDNGQGRIVGYNASTSVTITVRDFSLLNQAIDVATAAGVNQISGISFTLSEEKQKEVKGQAREIAITDAKANAQELASLTSMQLGRIIDIQENIPGNAQPVAFRSNVMNDMGGEAVAATGVEPGSTTYRYSVTLSYQTL